MVHNNRKYIIDTVNGSFFSIFLLPPNSCPKQKHSKQERDAKQFVQLLKKLKYKECKRSKSNKNLMKRQINFAALFLCKK